MFKIMMLLSAADLVLILSLGAMRIAGVHPTGAYLTLGASFLLGSAGIMATYTIWRVYQELD